MNSKPKTNAIDTPEILLDLFAQGIQNHRDGSVSLLAAALPGGQTGLRIEIENKKFNLEVWPRLTPSRQLLAEAKAKGPGKPFVLLCPHLPEELAADFRSAGVNHADLNGRLFVKTPSFLLDRGPRGKGYRNPVAAFNPFTLKSSRIVRSLLSRWQQEWTQVDLEHATGISRALVSLTLADLIERELVTQTRPGNRHQAALYRVSEFDRLLDAWAKEDNWRKRTVIRQYSVLAASLAEVAEICLDMLDRRNLFFTQWFAAHLRHPYTTPPLVSAYVKGTLPGAITWARPVDNGGNLWLIAPKDEGVFQEAQQVQGFNLVADVQIYLDLLPVSQRGPEQAQALRRWEGFSV